MPSFQIRPAATAALLLVLGLLLFKFGSGHLRGFGSDVLVVVFLVACLASFSIGRRASRVSGVLAFAVVVECIQAMKWVGPDSHWLLHLTLGSTFDVLDLLAYFIGAAVAWPIEHAWETSRPPTPPPSATH